MPGSGGVVYQVKLFRRRDVQGARRGLEAVGGGGTGEAIRLDADPKQLILVGSVPSPLFVPRYYPVS